MLRFLLAGIGGFIGSVLRFSIQIGFQKIVNPMYLPLGTLTTNVLGCFAIGFFGGLADHRNFFSTDTRIFLFVGILGGFTTYSTFGFETFKLLRAEGVMFGLLNLFLHFTLGLGSVWIAYSLARR